MSDADPDALARACAEAMWQEDHASRGLGMEITAISAGRAEIAMTLRPEMANGHGIAHGGFIFTLADTAFAFACNGYDDVTVAQSNSITYLAPGRVGDRLIARAREIARPGRSGLYDVTVTRASDGARIAEFRGQSRASGKPLLPKGDQR
ncbi:hydroxyphenylacetyl-CoA thioesterase PaaI [Roseivivax sp. GX 12232]|uniref:hydroxyphenylacetyl-CoA thioesterase PaaI n=1 Tax=Roseivivax sp. GX 12232 TaxID=2900547 RepID=UPI001E30B4B4|nr:hydroxyphenylacetyl-CoA thioesterase PaaI [Roseivivax sp. GX 12232]MCE0506521.1 hydroxyphenylacetyl-CoA thioesterase PaaI [Roseivivax sp. GX 12232]